MQKFIIKGKGEYMNEIEEVYKNVAKGLLNNFFYNKKVFAKQEKDENNRIVFMTKYQGIDVVKIKMLLCHINKIKTI